ncbi:hypothetical protein GCM10022219_09750 [Microbacterium oryzae]|nr:OmpA family protein [Microbacterium oryzae]
MAQTATRWAIGALAGANLPMPVSKYKLDKLWAGGALFSLLNQEAWVARDATAYGLGLTVGLPIGKIGSHTVELPTRSVSVDVSYEQFEAPKPLRFADFNGMSFRFTTATLGLIGGYTRSYLTLWDGPPYFGDQVAYVAFGDWGFALLPGGSVVHGRMQVLDSGSIYGTPAVPRMMPPLNRDDPLPEPFRYMQIAAKEGPSIRLPGDTLFDFDKSAVRREAEPELLYLLDLLNNRRKYAVTIEGHTDLTGTSAYNRDLSLRRAASVKRWLLERKAEGAKDYRVIGYGESRPIASNRTRAGRALNRRVTVTGSWNLVG